MSKIRIKGYRCPYCKSFTSDKAAQTNHMKHNHKGRAYKEETITVNIGGDDGGQETER